MIVRFALLAVVSCVSLLAQLESEPAAELQVDESDPMVTRARDNLLQMKTLVLLGALPVLRLRKAEEEVQDALDMSLLKKNLYSRDLTPGQINQMVFVAQKMVYRRKKSMAEMMELVNAGVVSRAEGEATSADMDRAKKELDLAEARAKLIQQLAESLRIERVFASVETEAEFHPEWNGKVYLKYDGSGVFSRADLSGVESAFIGKFLKPLPVSADGETTIHRSLGFDHRGRVDVAVSPDQPEGAWLMKYLEGKHIPYFAFRTAVPGRATGAHIHLGPQSTRLAF